MDSETKCVKEKEKGKRLEKGERQEDDARVNMVLNEVLFPFFPIFRFFFLFPSPFPGASGG